MFWVFVHYKVKISFFFLSLCYQFLDELGTKHIYVSQYIFPAKNECVACCVPHTMSTAGWRRTMRRELLLFEDQCELSSEGVFT